MVRLKVALLGLAALALLSACAGGETGGQPSGKPLVISPQANDHLRKYMAEIAAGRAGAFAVAENGGAAHYTVCESGSCNGQYHFSSLAIKGCERAGSGRCVILASNGVIKRPYTVGDSTDALSAKLQALLNEQDAPLVNPEYVSGDRIRKALIGNSFVEENAEGKIWAEYYDPSGAVRGHNWRGKRFAGTWKIEGNKMCVDYTSIGNDWCGQFAEGKGGAIESYKDGRLLRTYPKSVLQAGNPRKL
jgi:hypothetical protein